VAKGFIHQIKILAHINRFPRHRAASKFNDHTLY
jgi:hypothetical protein